MVLETEDTIPGKNIYMTLDIRLQRRAEELLAGKVGAVVAMDPNNGDVLALASSPAFDPNDFVEGLSFDKWNEMISNEFHPMTDKAIQGQYPPGSTYKVLTALAGLEEGVITQDTEVYCPGFYRYGNRTYRCWNRSGHGRVTLVDAIAESCDVYFFQAGEKLGVDRLAKYASACGLGERTGIALDNEAAGLVPTTTWKIKKVGVPWQAGETLSVAIGQGFNLTTPLQMASLYAALANGGTLYKPVVVHAVRAVDDDMVPFQGTQVIGKLPVSEKNLAKIKEGLVKVVEDRSGTARRIHIPGLSIAGKTGTAQVVALGDDDAKKKDEEIPYRFRDHAWFVAFAPAEAPRIVVSVIVEHGEHGSTTAAPIAKEIIGIHCRDLIGND
jgi:penicillin-binding protein 2